LANESGGKFAPARDQKEIASELAWMYRLETNSVAVRFTYEADRKGRPARTAMLELRRPAGPLQANLPGAVSAIHRGWPIWWWLVLLVVLVVLAGGGAFWFWSRRPPRERVRVTPVPEKSETLPPFVVTDPLPLPRRETVIIGQYFPAPASGRPAVLLRGIAGPAKGREWAMEREVFSIGADADSDLSIAADEYVSGAHAYLRYEHGSLFIFDKGSRNGTFVNDSRVTESGAVLRPGDRVTLGQSTFSVVMPGQ
jgi:Inner membrane component of T3SS, cytoplasmic domain